MREAERRELLRYAREVLAAKLAGRPLPSPPRGGAFDEPRGAFVTLKRGGELRGCIGRVVADRPLGEVIRDMAVEAAFHDPRFPPLAPGELDEVEIEISVLSPFEKVKSEEEIVVGRDGLMLVLGYRSGLLLPQVPVEWNWDREEFLRHLCAKAGLPPGAHRHPEAELYRFTAEVFSESDFS